MKFSQKKAQQDKSCSFIFHRFGPLSVVQVSYGALIKRDFPENFPENLHLYVHVKINKHLFEPFCVWIQQEALKSSTQRTQTSGIFVKQVVFLTVNHHRLLPLKELHSTCKTMMWRDPGALEPVYHLFMIMSEITLPHLQNMLQKAVCRTCPKKQLRKKKSPTKC